MLRLMILGTITVLMINSLYGTTTDARRTISPDVYVVAAGTDARLDSTYMLPEMVITAPRIVDGTDYSYARYQYDRIYFQIAARRLLRIAGYMIMATMSVIWIVLAIIRIPHINRVRSKKKHHISYVNLVRTGHKPWMTDRRP